MPDLSFGLIALLLEGLLLNHDGHFADEFSLFVEFLLCLVSGSFSEFDFPVIICEGLLAFIFGVVACANFDEELFVVLDFSREIHILGDFHQHLCALAFVLDHLSDDGLGVDKLLGEGFQSVVRIQKDAQILGQSLFNLQQLLEAEILKLYHFLLGRRRPAVS